MRTSPSVVLQHKKKSFSTALLAWYAIHARDLPWRSTNNPYYITVSELMLQQTQVDRVIEKYTQWITTFPTLEVLANSSTKEVIRLWQGLGYNRRALYLHRLAQTVVKECYGVFPRTVEELQQLPGIGPYTAGAIASFAFNADEPIVDTNVKRVIGRIFLGYKKVHTVKEDVLWELATTLLPKRGKTYFFNQALMDFGSRICTAKKPKCEMCPFQKICLSYPAIQHATAKELTLPSVTETLYFGKPRRIWRGKILKYLHTIDPQGATLASIGKHIQDDFDSSRLAWLKSVMEILKNDGFVTQVKSKYFLP